MLWKYFSNFDVIVYDLMLSMCRGEVQTKLRGLVQVQYMWMKTWLN